MKQWSFYNADGFFHSHIYSGDLENLSINTPYGTTPIEGAYDLHRFRVLFETGIDGLNLPIVVSWRPPSPPDDDFQTWVWSDDIERWISIPTLAAQSRSVRAERDRRLAACDWVVARSFERAEPVPAAWAAYRAALRDVTVQPGFPTVIDWPVVPI
jgi:hypothetical protein